MFETSHGLDTRSYTDSALGHEPRPRDFAHDTLLDRFNRQFKALTADSPELMRQAMRVRYQVYCIEHPLESAQANSNGIETDEFDSHAVHSLLLSRQTLVPLGTVRLILPRTPASEESFAVQRLLNASSLKILNSLPLHSTAEISRFSISQHSRRQPRCLEHHFGPAPASHSGPLMRLGLMQGIMRMTVKAGITDWCALMEPTLLRMLSAMAIRFRPIGPLVEFRGLRQPCWLNVSDMLRSVRAERPAFWEMITDGGALDMCSGTARRFSATGN
jgi:N-acyl amino acid synthase of PEP-CTERM/exosortase system